jgi:hypothetical protein
MHLFWRGSYYENSNAIDACIGKEVYFGEILGRHSEIYGTLDKEDLEVLTDNQDEIEIIEKYIGNSFGLNPIKHLREDR